MPALLNAGPFDSALREPLLIKSSVCLGKEGELMFVVGCLGLGVFLVFFFLSGGRQNFSRFLSSFTKQENVTIFHQNL